MANVDCDRRDNQLSLKPGEFRMLGTCGIGSAAPGVKIAHEFHQETNRGRLAVITGKTRAWIEHCAQGVLVAFIAVSGEDNAPLKRPPGCVITICATCSASSDPRAMSDAVGLAKHI
jgi:hypothetical protein